jgi:hypothetical protein
MSQLGSFKRQTFKRSSAEDQRPRAEAPLATDLKSNLGYLLGVYRNSYPYEEALQTSTGPGIRGGSRGGPRMAGEALRTFFSAGEEAAEPLPLEGNAELRTPYLQ